jgi:hypothetical protein
MALPDPECGRVISYFCLWRHETEDGRTEGVKARPCVFVLARAQNDGTRRITVAPITHSPPLDPTTAIEIPPKAKQHLALDGERSWVVLDDFNEFTWPGFDLCPVPGMPGRYDYGLLPPALFARIAFTVLCPQPWPQLISVQQRASQLVEGKLLHKSLDFIHKKPNI